MAPASELPRLGLHEPALGRTRARRGQQTMVRMALPLTLAVLAITGCGGDRRDVSSAGVQGSLVVQLTRPVWLRATPGGRRLAYLRTKTEFGSTRVVHVVTHRGPWAGVLDAALHNGQIGWLDTRHFARLFRVHYTLEANLARRMLTVRRSGRIVTRTRIAIGSRSAPTPVGRFAVTDKLVPGNPYGPYGCCVLALTGHQTRGLEGWGGGDRLAIHATAATETIGQAVSHGCLRTTNAVMRRLVRRIPLGTPVVIHR